MTINDQAVGRGLAHHQLSWVDFDSLARGAGGADVIRRLRRTQRSRRLLLLRAWIDEVTPEPDLYEPLHSPNEAWDLLARVQAVAPDAFDLVLAHPYTGAWLGYTRRLIHKRIHGDGSPAWVHIGHFQALAAAAAIRAGIDFQVRIPVRSGEAIIPTLGTARLTVDTRFSFAEVRGDAEGVRVANETEEVVLPHDTSEDGPGWWGLRRLVTQEVNQCRLEVRLDDLDPYRGLHEPALAERTDPAEAKEWDALLDEAWRLIVENLPDLAGGLSAGLDSLVPRPEVPFKYMSGSTSETFGSTVIAKPPTPALLASALVHEFQHSRLNALMHFTRLTGVDPRERYYTLWRDDPRPVAGVLHGVYAFFGMTAFWRALATTGDRRALFEFAYTRGGTWQTLTELRRDPALTPVGQRFVERIAERLAPWVEEPIPPDIAALASAAAADHHAGWRLRHLRPSPETVSRLVEAWQSRQSISNTLPPDPAPTTEPDGTWPGARLELIRLAADGPAGSRATLLGASVPGVLSADIAYVTGNLAKAVDEYTSVLAAHPDSTTAWAGLGLANAALGNIDIARALLEHPELVRAVHMEMHQRVKDVPAPDRLAAWIGSQIA